MSKQCAPSRQFVYKSSRTVVYRELDSAWDRPVVHKQPLGLKALDRLHHEAAILRRLQGVPGVAQLVDEGHTLVLEEVPGTPLFTNGTRRWDLDSILAIAPRMARIVVDLHRRGVVHKDINPSNFVLGQEPVLIDFDLATTFAQERPAFVHHSEIAGTLAYMAPEQTGRTGRGVDYRVDLYGLGATLYEMAGGQPPFPQGDPLEVIHDVLARNPIPLKELDPNIPRGLSDIVARLLEKEPDRRYGSAEGLEYDLTRLAGLDEQVELGSRDFPLRLSPPSRLVGRDRELAMLAKGLDEVAQGASKAVMVSGSPGVGKTSLINELRREVTGHRGWFAAGKFDQYGQEVGVAAMQALGMVGRLLLAEPGSQLALERSRLLAALGVNAGLLAGAVPEFASVLGLKNQTLSGDSADGQLRLRQAVLDALRVLARPSRPLVLFVDDLQWAGEFAIGMLDAIISDESLQGLLLVGAYRAEEIDAVHPLSSTLTRWIGFDQPPIFLALENLAPSDTEALLEEVLRLPPSQSSGLAKLLLPHTGGNPYDTVEFLNALREEGLLCCGAAGWEWDPASVNGYLGRGQVLDLLTERIARLPEETARLLEVAACLGGDVPRELLRVATELTETVMEENLGPALEAGLLVQTDAQMVTFVHDRVQQAAYEGLDPQPRQTLHLTLARRLAASSDHRLEAAEHYYRTVQELSCPEEKRRVAELFLDAGGRVRRSADYSWAERLLSGALSLLDEGVDPSVLVPTLAELHSTLYSLGRSQEADRTFARLQDCGPDLFLVAEATCVQVSSLASRGLHDQALQLGLAMLGRMGLVFPQQGRETLIAEGLAETKLWLKTEPEEESELADPRLRMVARLINRLLVPALSCDQQLNALMVLESRSMWQRYGANPELVSSVTAIGRQAAIILGDYHLGYSMCRRVFRLEDRPGYETVAAFARFVFYIDTWHWHHPLEDCLDQLETAHRASVQGGDPFTAALCWMLKVDILFEHAPTLESCAAQAETGMVFVTRMGGMEISTLFETYKNLVSYLSTGADRSLAVLESDPVIYHPVGQVMALVPRALNALIFGDTPAFLRWTEALVPCSPNAQSFYCGSLSRLLRGLASAERVHRHGTRDSETLKELDTLCVWLQERAADCPANFLAMSHWLLAERAWVAGQPWEAMGRYEAALEHYEDGLRPWQRAIATERAGLFYLSQGLGPLGRSRLAQARQLYWNWGAATKVKQMEQLYPFLDQATAEAWNLEKRSSIVPSSSLDLRAILAASQALSSETSLERLHARVVETLRCLAGATGVLMAFHDGSQWQVLLPPEAETISLDEAGRRRMLPLSAFRYAERTTEPLVLADAAKDDRFSGDPYLDGVAMCSLMVLPLLDRGVLRSMLILENRLGRGAFTPERMDAVVLIGGQLAVSLNNALNYQSLEQKVAERTAELAKSLALVQATLEATTDGILVTAGNQVTSFNERFLRLWNIPPELSAPGPDEILVQYVLPQLKDPVGFKAGVEHHRDTPGETYDEIEFLDGRVYERHSKPQLVEKQRVGRVWSFRDVTERRRNRIELERAHRQLVEASRRAGMAEVATNVLHNVGNVLNSVNISAGLAAETVRDSKVSGLSRVVALLKENSGTDQGRRALEYLDKLAGHLEQEHRNIFEELKSLTKNVDHIKEIVRAQQSYSRVVTLIEQVDPAELFEDSLRIDQSSFQRHGIEIIRDFASMPPRPLERHSVLQILVNLISNAKHACLSSQRRDSRIVLSLEETGGRLLFRVSDNGVGLAPEHRDLIFTHGFTTRPDGHGFGLHGGALAAQEMGGSITVQSNGLGHGATFTLELPDTKDITHFVGDERV